MNSETDRAINNLTLRAALNIELVDLVSLVDVCGGMNIDDAIVELTEVAFTQRHEPGDVNARWCAVYNARNAYLNGPAEYLANYAAKLTNALAACNVEWTPE